MLVSPLRYRAVPLFPAGSSIRKPRFFTCSSIRPRYSLLPSGSQRTRLRVSVNWLRDIPFAFHAALVAFSKALKLKFSLFCFIVISSNYILYVIFHLSFQDMTTNSTVLTEIEHIMRTSIGQDKYRRNVYWQNWELRLY